MKPFKCVITRTTGLQARRPKIRQVCGGDRGRAWFASWLLAGHLLAAGCEPETRVVYYRPPLAGLPGAQTGDMVTAPRFKGYSGEAVPDDKIVEEAPGGGKILHAKNGRHLMIHIYRTLEEGEEELFTEQVLSEMTKKEFYERGYDPAEAFRELTRRSEDVKKLFDQMPMAEQTPGVFARGVGKGVQRIEVTGRAAIGLNWTGMDMVLERGNWRLRWFYGE